MNISDWRKNIDALEDDLVELLNKRASYAIEIGKIKKKEGLPVLDQAREEEILDRVSKKTKGPFSSMAIREIFKKVIEETRKIEE
jgi:chorismate mutase